MTYLDLRIFNSARIVIFLIADCEANLGRSKVMHQTKGEWGDGATLSLVFDESQKKV